MALEEQVVLARECARISAGVCQHHGRNREEACCFSPRLSGCPRPPLDVVVRDFAA